MRRRWVYTRWFALLVGLLTGALVGLAVYWGSRLTGAALYTLCGTVAGGVAATVFYAYSRTVRLTELKVSIPNLTDLTFAITPFNEGIAWRLFVESVTRISTQPLDQGSGVIHEALDSLYVLFQSVRGILLEARPTAGVGSTPTVEHLAIGMLNIQMRPFMAKWHARLSEWEERNPVRASRSGRKTRSAAPRWRPCARVCSTTSAGSGSWPACATSRSCWGIRTLPSPHRSGNSTSVPAIG